MGSSKHLPGVRALFEVTASHPNDAVTFSRVIAKSGLKDIQQRNEHARLSRISAELFCHKQWPIEAWQGSPKPGNGTAEMLYRMDRTVGNWWTELCDNDS